MNEGSPRVVQVLVSIQVSLILANPDPLQEVRLTFDTLGPGTLATTGFSPHDVG